jgi:hypothetical protein
MAEKLFFIKVISYIMPIKFWRLKPPISDMAKYSPE